MRNYNQAIILNYNRVANLRYSILDDKKKKKKFMNGKFKKKIDK